MKITRARVINYRSIDDSSWVNLEDVTALVGKNESGKTAFLQAIRKINSIAGEDDKFVIRDFPRKGYIKYKKIHEENPCTVAKAEFELSQKEVSEIEANFGEGVLASNKVIVGKNYKNERIWELDVSESTPVIDRTSSFSPAPVSVTGAISDNIKSEILSPVAKKIADDFLERWLPKFVYFDSYSTMRGKISISDLKKRTAEGGPFDDADRTFMSLLTLSGVSLEELEEDLGYEDVKVELESASITITDEIFEYCLPQRQGFKNYSAGQRRDDKIFDETAVVGVQEFASRLQAGITPTFARWADFQAGSNVPDEQKSFN